MTGKQMLVSGCLLPCFHYISEYHTEWSQTEKDKDIVSHMWTLLLKWCKWTYCENRKRATDLGSRLRLPGGKGGGGDKLGVWGWHVHTAVYGIDDRRGSTAQNKELYSIFRNGLPIWEKNQKKNGYIYISVGI